VWADMIAVSVRATTDSEDGQLTDACDSARRHCQQQRQDIARFNNPAENKDLSGSNHA